MWAHSLGQKDSLEEGTKPLQYSCLDNPMGRGAWQATVHGVTKSQTRLKDISKHAYTHTLQSNLEEIKDTGSILIKKVIWCFYLLP